MRAMVVAIRTATVTTVRVTNYKRDGSTFVNSLTMSPVHDSDGVYRYSIGVLADAADGASDSASLSKLRAALPRTMQADAQPAAFDPSVCHVDADAQLAQYVSSKAVFTRLEWSLDWEAALSRLLGSEAGLVGFGSWLQGEAPGLHVDLITNMLELDTLPPSETGPRAIKLCDQYFDVLVSDPEDALSMLKQISVPGLAAIRELAPRFLSSDSCVAVVSAVLAEETRSQKKLNDLLWAAYSVPADCAGWL